MKTGDKVKLTHEISYPGKDEYDEPITGILEKGTLGNIAGMVQAGDDIMVLFQPEGVEQVFAVRFTSVKKTK